MTLWALPLPMVLVFAAVLMAGWVSAIHFVIVHMVLVRPVSEALPAALERASSEAHREA